MEPRKSLPAKPSRASAQSQRAPVSSVPEPEAALAPTPPPAEPEQAPSSAAQSQEGRKRVRRWHQRGFTGCLTCRRRHVRCDEGSPSCNNCLRLGLECDGAEGRMTFKTYGLPTNPQSASASTKKRSKKNDSPVTTTPGSPSSEVAPNPPSMSSSSSSRARHQKENKLKKRAEEMEDDEDIREDDEEAQLYDSAAAVIQHTNLPFRQSAGYSQQQHERQTSPWSPDYLLSLSIDSRDGRYFTHFVNRLSGLLIVDDRSFELNPLRTHLPELSRSSPSMVEAMQALAALHLANTSQGQQRIIHFQNAVAKYDGVVKSFRTRTAASDQELQHTDFAVCLLLCLFEVGWNCSSGCLIFSSQGSARRRNVADT